MLEQRTQLSSKLRRNPRPNEHGCGVGGSSRGIVRVSMCCTVAGVYVLSVRLGEVALHGLEAHEVEVVAAPASASRCSLVRQRQQPRQM